MAGPSLLDHFSALEDPRQAWKVGYPLPEILLVVLCGTIAGAENFVAIERWANRSSPSCAVCWRSGAACPPTIR